MITLEGWRSYVELCKNDFKVLPIQKFLLYVLLTVSRPPQSIDPTSQSIDPLSKNDLAGNFELPSRDLWWESRFPTDYLDDCFGPVNFPRHSIDSRVRAA